MARLYLRLFGLFQIGVDEQPITSLKYDKARALLAYLALADGRPIRRESLAALLWPELPTAKARHNLRQALLALRQALAAAGYQKLLLTSRSQVQLDLAGEIDVDAHRFRALLAACEEHDHAALAQCSECAGRLAEAVGLYGGDFMDGFYVDNSAPLEAWLGQQRETWSQKLTTALSHLADFHLYRQAYEQAQPYIERQLELDSFREEGHRQMMRLLFYSGRPNAALIQYESCRRLLAEELGVEPAAETEALYREIRRAKGARPVRLPAALTSLVGRQREGREVGERLAQAGCRLLTIVGPGGIGKTRLAIQVIQEQGDLFLDGVCFVPLTAVDRPAHLPTILASCLEIAAGQWEEPQTALWNFLRDRQMLLILDNFEHLLAGRSFILELLQQAPGLKLLITSRAPLKVQPEWVFRLNGLAYPDDAGAVSRSSLAEQSAVQLFVQRATQANHAFVLHEDNLTAAARICRLVQGNPLALELAAASTTLYNCREIADEIERNLDFLTAALHDVPARHHSLRAVFDHSWRLLSPAERQALSRLSFFAGSFDRETAQQVAEVEPAVLASLIDKSLLRPAAAGARFELLDAIGRFAGEHLADPAAIARRHSRRYLDFLAGRQTALQTGRRKEALAEIAADFADARLAWQNAVRYGYWSDLAPAVESFYLFHEIQGWLAEAAPLFAAAAAPLAASSDRNERKLWAALTARQGRCCLYLGQYERARQLLTASRQRFSALEWIDEEIAALINLAVVEMFQGAYDEAGQLCREVLALAQKAGDQRGEAMGLNLLGNQAQMTGEYEQARRFFEEALTLRRAIDDQFGAAITLNNLGNIAQTASDYAEARRLYEESYAFFHRLNYKLGMAAALTNAGYVAWRRGQYSEARRLHQESLAIKREIGNQRSIALSLANLGEVACSTGAFRESEGYFKEAIGLSLSVEAMPLAVDALVGLSTVYAQQGRVEQAVEFLTLALDQPAARRETTDRAATLLEELAAELPPGVVSAARQRGSARQLRGLQL